MINLKKALSVMVASAILTTSFVPAFAASNFVYEAQAKTLYELGLFKGVSMDPNVFEPALGDGLDRQQGITMMLRLVGKIDTANAMSDADTNAALSKFTDASKLEDWAKKPVAYAIKNGLVIGTTGTTIAPEETFAGKMFAGLILRNIGYDVTAENYDRAAYTLAEKGGLTNEQATAFNDKNLIRDDAVGMSYGSLKAKYASTQKTIIETLVTEKKVDEAKAIAAGLIQSFGVTNGARTITVKLNTAPADPSKVAIVVTRDAGVAVPTTFTQDSVDKTVFTYTSSTNLTTGDYKVNVKVDTSDLGNRTFKVEEEKVQSIEILSKQIIRLSDTKGYVKYRVTNNYGEDVTKEGIASSIEWRTSLPSGSTIDANKGTLTIEYGSETSTGYLSQLRDYTNTPIVVTGYNKDSATTVTKNMTVSATVGDIASIKLLGIENKDGKTAIYRGDNDEFYLDYEIKDSNGELITSYELLSNENALRVNPNIKDGNPMIAAIEIVQNPDSPKDALFKIRLREGYNQENPFDGVGTQPINVVAMQTGKTATFNVEVKENNAEVASLAVQKPSTTVTSNSGLVEIPYVAYDGAGKQVTAYSDIYGNVEFKTSHGSIMQTYDSNGNFKLYVDFTGVPKDTTVTISATVKRTFKYSYTTVSVKEATTPYEISSASFDTNYLAQGANIDFAIDKFKILDKNGNELNLKNDYAKEYYIKATSSNSDIIAVNKEKAQGAEKINLIAGDKDGSVNITFTLYGPDGAIASKSVTFRNVKSKDIASYGIEAISKSLYSAYDSNGQANADSAVPVKGNDSALSTEAYRAEIKVRGYMAGGQKVYLTGKDMSSESGPVYAATYSAFVDSSSYSVNDPSKFTVIGKNVYALYDESGSAKVSAVVYVDGLPRPVSADVTSSTAAPVAASVSVAVNDVNSGSAYTPVVKDKGGDFYEMSAADFAKYVVGKRLTKYDNSTGVGTADERSSLYFKVADQYGKEGMNPSITLLQGEGLTLTKENGNAKLTGTLTGSQVRLNATCNGVTKTITINVK